ncbi:hypothetical protein EWM58_05235 [Candidatus Erwinia dacicola]|nr:hypothetical protein [Candidatus Erwinia dacicola]
MSIIFNGHYRVKHRTWLLEVLPVARKRPRRPNFPRDFKIALVAKSMQPGVSVAQLARENNINDNLQFNWGRVLGRGVNLEGW